MTTANATVLHWPDDRRNDTVRGVRGELRTIELPELLRGHRVGRAPSRDAVRGRHDHRDLRLQYWSGQAWQLGSAAYWESIAQQAVEPVSYELGASLVEELGACLLGGYGMPFSLANAAFERLRDEGVFDTNRSWRAAQVEALLTKPLDVNGKLRRYRFPKQRSARLVAALGVLNDVGEPALESMTDRALRDWLTSLPGVGEKTASWVVRNHRASNDVAIIDIHLIRAGVVAGVFRQSWRPQRHYALYEAAFLDWARHADVPPRFLDACIWGALTTDPLSARDILGWGGSDNGLRPVWPIDRYAPAPDRRAR